MASVNSTGPITRIYPGDKDLVYFRLGGEGPRPSKYFVLRKIPANGDFWFNATYSLLLAAFVNRIKISVSTKPFTNTTEFVDVIYIFSDRPG